MANGFHFSAFETLAPRATPSDLLARFPQPVVPPPMAQDAARAMPLSNGPSTLDTILEMLRTRPVQVGAKTLGALGQSALPEPARSARFPIPGLSDVPKSMQERLMFEFGLADQELRGRQLEQGLLARQAAHSMPPILQPL